MIDLLNILWVPSITLGFEQETQNEYTGELYNMTFDL